LVSIGDQLLQSVAERWVGCVSNSDTISRQHGHEFVVLLSEIAQPEEAALRAQWMLAYICATLTHVADPNDVALHTPSPVVSYESCRSPNTVIQRPAAMQF
jgi:GGDEF domain-containing protein